MPKAIFFLAFGIVFVVLNEQIYEYDYQYDVTCNPSGGTLVPNYCPINITIGANLQPPIYFYYELSNYFQNHRVYLESRDDDQLYGIYKTIDQLGSCTPIMQNSQVQTPLTNYWNSNMILSPNDPATPCGLIAQTLFNGLIFLFIYK